jgi:hypothetical protein
MWRPISSASGRLAVPLKSLKRLSSLRLRLRLRSGPVWPPSRGRPHRGLRVPCAGSFGAAARSARRPAVCLPHCHRQCFRFHLRMHLQAGWLWLLSGVCVRNLAGRPGFEPGQMPPKGIVLPLDDRPTLQPPASLSRKRLPVKLLLAKHFAPVGRARQGAGQGDSELQPPQSLRAASASPRVRYNPKSAEPDPDSEAWRAASGVPEPKRMRLISAREGCWGKTTRSKSFWIQLLIPVRTSADSYGSGQVLSN